MVSGIPQQDRYGEPSVIETDGDPFDNHFDNLQSRIGASSLGAYERRFAGASTSFVDLFEIVDGLGCKLDLLEVSMPHAERSRSSL